MPIAPQNGDQSSGCNVIPDVYVNKDAGAVVYTRFSNLFAAIHVDVSGTIVADGDASGATSMSLNVGAAGTLIVWGTYSGSGAFAAVTLT